MAITVLAKRLNDRAKVPRYSHMGPYGDLAADLFAASEDCSIEPLEIASIGTGLAMQFPQGYGALVEDRSGLALRGIITLGGVIDPGYRGEIKVVLCNLSKKTTEIKAGDRIAQIRIVPLIQASFSEVEDLEGTLRGQSGFGSTGSS
jgi:dUTP pyrophosphatase